MLEIPKGIEGDGYNTVKTKEVEILAGSVGLLKCTQTPSSLDFVTTNWDSWPLTSNGI